MLISLASPFRGDHFSLEFLKRPEVIPSFVFAKFANIIFSFFSGGNRHKKGDDQRNNTKHGTLTLFDGSSRKSPKRFTRFKKVSQSIQGIPNFDVQFCVLFCLFCFLREYLTAGIFSAGRWQCCFRFSLCALWGAHFFAF